MRRRRRRRLTHPRRTLNSEKLAVIHLTKWCPSVGGRNERQRKRKEGLVCEEGIVLTPGGKKEGQTNEGATPKKGEKKRVGGVKKGFEKERSGSPTLDAKGGGFHSKQMTNRRFVFGLTDVRGKQHHACRQQADIQRQSSDLTLLPWMMPSTGARTHTHTRSRNSLMPWRSSGASLQTTPADSSTSVTPSHKAQRHFTNDDPKCLHLYKDTEENTKK